MKFNVRGSRENPVVVMLPGSFCPARSMAYLYERLTSEYCIVLPEYNGHYEGTTFTTRAREAAEIAAFLEQRGFDTIRLVYGQSMGAEVGIELVHQLAERGAEVQKAFFDGAPCITLSRPYKALMGVKFRKFIRMVRGKTVDEVLGMKLVAMFSNGDPESLRPMVEPVVEVAPYLSIQSILNETECCYTFDFPELSEEMQKNTLFLYAREEKAYKTCYEGVKRAYPHARYHIVDGYGHMTYSVKKTDEYLDLLRNLCSEVG